MKIEFLDLGKQPIANNFIKSLPIENEFFFNLKASFDEESKLVSLTEFVDKQVLFNDHYVYHSSSSETMIKHFRDTANHIISLYNPKKVLEVGSNDGIFLRYFNNNSAFGVEPCGNFAQITNNMGYKTFPVFWNTKTTPDIINEIGYVDVVFAANCMCHIPEILDAFIAAYNILNYGGVFIFEDPSLMPIISIGSYDQFYDEHAHIFSASAIVNLLESCGFFVENIKSLDVHGGSNRYYARKIDSKIQPYTVQKTLYKEEKFGINNAELYIEFGNRVNQSKIKLLEILDREKSTGGKIIGYGATSKSTVVYNFCNINSDILEYVTDTTVSKQGSFTPGTHIPVIKYNGIPDDITHAFLGAWNFEKEITLKEKAFLERGGKFITHVPEPRIIG